MDKLHRQKRNKPLSLSHVGRSIYETLEIIKLNHLFTIYNKNNDYKEKMGFVSL
jgi:hypothetical protein